MGTDYGAAVRRKAVMKLIAIASELNLSFHYNGLQSNRGILLIAEKGVSVEYLMQILKERLEAVEFKSLEDWEQIQNYQLGVHEFDRHDEEVDLYKFLNCKDFLPAVIAREIVPDVLRGMAFCVKISKAIVKDMNTHDFANEVYQIRKFVRSNPELVVEDMNRIKSERMYLGDGEKASFFICLVTAGEVYCTFIRHHYTKKEMGVSAW